VGAKGWAARAALVAVAGAAGVAGLVPAAPAGARPAVVRAALPAGRIQHVLVIDLENEGYATTFGPGSPAPYLSRTLPSKGALLVRYFATGHNSLDNYISQVSGQAPTTDTQADCADNGFTFAPVAPGTPAPRNTGPGQVSGQGCVYPTAVPTLAAQLDAKYPPNASTHRAAWRAYEEDMGSDPARDGGTACAHPALGTPDHAVVATPSDQYATRHNPFVWFQSVIGSPAECQANDVPLGPLTAAGTPSPTGALAQDLRSVSTTPRFGFITPNLCNDGHDGTCAGTNSAGTHVGGLAGANIWLQHWMPLLLNSPAYRQGHTLIVVTFDEADLEGAAAGAACCRERPGPNTVAPGDAAATTNAAAPGGGQVGAVLLAWKYIRPGTVDRARAYNHYSALRSYEDLLGLTTGGADGQGHLGMAAAPGLAPFGRDVFTRP
jgi:hypothetical protein